MEQPLLSIIYVNFESADELAASLASLLKFTTGITFEIVVVDNSKDDHLEEKLKKYDNIRYFESENKGFGAANNLGSKKATGQFLLFLNPDTLIADDSVVKMVDYLKTHHEVGALSPILYNPDGQLQKHFYAHFMSPWGVTFGRWTGREIDLTQTAVAVGMVSGAALMVKRELFEKIGGYDEKFFMYLEDDDLCLRLHRAGYQNRVLTTAKITHLEGRSSASSDRKKWYYKSQDYYFKKHYGLPIMLIMKLIRLPYRVASKN
jgi:GT2 family glycosyltransferase